MVLPEFTNLLDLCDLEEKEEKEARRCQEAEERRKAAKMEVPPQFLGKFYEEIRAENLNEFLAIRGVPWLIRKLISGKLRNARFNLIKLADGSFEMDCGDTSRPLKYRFELGKKFTAMGYDGKQHEITFAVEGGRFKEIHLNLARPETGEDVFWYEVRNGTLYSECTASDDRKSVTWKREFETRL